MKTSIIVTLLSCYFFVGVFSSSAALSRVESNVEPGLNSHALRNTLHHSGVARSLLERAVTVKSKNKRPKTCSQKPKNNTTTAKPKAAVQAAPKGTFRGSSACGSSQATVQITKQGGPNGNMGFLNCGVDQGGWNPPTITLKTVITKSLSQVMGNSVFTPCEPYFHLFQKYGDKYGIPPMMLAAFAMQESTCNPNAPTGGLMQITPDKCGGAPNGNCNDPAFNVNAAASYFSTVVSNFDGNIVAAVGSYNGWNPGMTVGQAKNRQYGCMTQRNLDYLQQYFNGWLQGVNPYSLNLGKYFNIANC